MQEKKYRPNVAIIVLAPSYPFECKVLVAQRTDIKGVWQFPQGGIDEGESPQEAALRELKEEIGTNKVEIIAEHPSWLEYDFPESAAKKMAPFAGQSQKYFLVRLKPAANIDINTPKPEFDDYKFIKIEELDGLANDLKKDIYNKVIAHFKNEGYL